MGTCCLYCVPNTTSTRRRVDAPASRLSPSTRARAKITRRAPSLSGCSLVGVRVKVTVPSCAVRCSVASSDPVVDGSPINAHERVAHEVAAGVRNGERHAEGRAGVQRLAHRP